jgi:hypothetical protein
MPVITLAGETAESFQLTDSESAFKLFVFIPILNFFAKNVLNFMSSLFVNIESKRAGVRTIKMVKSLFRIYLIHNRYLGGGR